MSELVYHILYASESAADIERSEVDKILAVSRVNNEKLSITGLLISRERYFIQLLEGHEAAVIKVFHKISRDPRHQQVRILCELKSQARMFPKWSMGFIDPTAAASTMADVWPIITTKAPTIQRDKNAILAYFRTFNQG